MTTPELWLALFLGLSLALNAFSLWATARLEREVNSIKFDLMMTDWSPLNQGTRNDADPQND